jgi:dipeptidase D
MVDVYREMFQKEMRVESIHAGLECGIIASKLPNLDIVSTGPDILDIHTPQERLSIESVKRTYAYVLKVLEILAS